MIDSEEGFEPLLVRRARANPPGLFARYDGVPVSFGDLDRMANILALWMRRIGLVPGDMVALMLRNSPLALALLFAIARARAIWLPINVQSRGENLGYIFNHSAPKLIIAEAALTATIQASGANILGVQVFTADMVRTIASGGGHASPWSEARACS